jgi:hypothetical protein
MLWFKNLLAWCKSLFHLTSIIKKRSIANDLCWENLEFWKKLMGKGVTNKGLVTKPIPNKPKTMEVKFTCLEVLVINMLTNMVTQMKSNVHASSKVFKWKDSLSFNLDVDPQIFLWSKIFKPTYPWCNDVKYFKQPRVLNNWWKPC